MTHESPEPVLRENIHCSRNVDLPANMQSAGKPANMLNTVGAVRRGT